MGCLTKHVCVCDRVGPPFYFDIDDEENRCLNLIALNRYLNPSVRLVQLFMELRQKHLPNDVKPNG